METIQNEMDHETSHCHAAGRLRSRPAAPHKKGFEKPGFAFGCPIGDAKVSSMEDLVKAKVVIEGKRTTIRSTEMRCTMTGDLLKIDANLNNDSSKVKRIAYRFRWIDREGMRAWEEEVWKPLLMYENTNQRRHRHRTHATRPWTSG